MSLLKSILKGILQGILILCVSLQLIGCASAQKIEPLEATPELDSFLSNYGTTVKSDEREKARLSLIAEAEQRLRTMHLMQDCMDILEFHRNFRDVHEMRRCKDIAADFHEDHENESEFYLRANGFEGETK